MKPRTDLPIHLTYCLSVHGGETWEENFAEIKNEAMQVKKSIAPSAPFGLGLRLSKVAASELAKPERIEQLKRFLKDNDLYVFTINGFPYGKFHEDDIKENVYAPDWSTEDRRDYTITLADILANLLPDGLYGSISTVPLSYRQWGLPGEKLHRMVGMLAETAVYFHEIFQSSGKDICLALEPEPDCIIENTDETIEFFSGPLLEIGVEYLKTHFQISSEVGREILKRHIGVCFDTAHMSVEFEDMTDSLKKLKNAGIRIAKTQISAGVIVHPSAEGVKQIARFAESRYLHQVRIKTQTGDLVSFRDLPEALEKYPDPGQSSQQWRVHFHVPLFFERNGDLRSTSECITDEFISELVHGLTEHIEIETYTYQVLPDDMKDKSLIHSIAKEYKWFLSRLDESLQDNSRAC